jgi:hypothetical protein
VFDRALKHRAGTAEDLGGILRLRHAFGEDRCLNEALKESGHCACTPNKTAKAD